MCPLFDPHGDLPNRGCLGPSQDLVAEMKQPVQNRRKPAYGPQLSFAGVKNLLDKYEAHQICHDENSKSRQEMTGAHEEKTIDLRWIGDKERHCEDDKNGIGGKRGDKGLDSFEETKPRQKAEQRAKERKDETIERHI